MCQRAWLFFTSIIKELYLILLFMLPKSQHKRATLVYYMTFEFNDAGMIQELAKKYGDQLVVFAATKVKAQPKLLRQHGIKVITLNHKNMILHNNISYLKQADMIVCDDYLPELAVVNVPEVLLLWHADGAIKKFGWGDVETRKRPYLDRRRFAKVYGKYTAILSGSDMMSRAFEACLKVSPEIIKPLGFLRSDLYIRERHAAVRKTISVLYAPTYRDSNVEMLAILRQAVHIFAQLPTQQFVIKIHPSLTEQFAVDLPANVSLTTEPLYPLMKKSQTLITDYSSAVFEFMLITTKPQVIFFCPDYDSYQQSPGLQQDFLNWKIGPVLFNETELTNFLKQPAFADYLKNCRRASYQWNQYNDGKVKARTLNWIDLHLAMARTMKPSVRKRRVKPVMSTQNETN